MKLVTKIILGLSASVLIALGLWGVVFYFSLVGELTEEIDETLADYSNDIIVWSLAGEPLPYSDAVAYNTFEIREVTPEYAAANMKMSRRGTAAAYSGMRMTGIMNLSSRCRP